MQENINHEILISAVENIISGICIFSFTDNRSIIPVYINEGCYRMLGYTHKELEKMIQDIRRNIIPDDLPVVEQGIDDALKDDGAVEFEFRTVTRDGSLRWIQARMNLYGKEDGYPLIAGVFLDATERKSIEEELALQAERMNILSESVKEHIADYNSRTDVLSLVLNKSAYQKGEIVVHDFMENRDFASVSEEDREKLIDVLATARRSSLSDSVEFRCNAFGEGEDYHWYKMMLTSVRGADGYVSRVIGRIKNIDEDKKKELELQIKADKDALTGLYNKGASTTLITEAIKKCEQEEQKAALIMLDLDHFKSVNDTFGHAVGDMVIADAGKILNDTFKGRDIVGRMGGDEFMVFMADIRGKEDAINICMRLNKSLTRKLKDASGSVTVTASIGISMCEGSGNDFEKLYKEADKALYTTKENGRNGLTLFQDLQAE